MAEQIALIILGLAVGGGLIWWYLRQRPRAPVDTTQDHLIAFQRLINEQLDRLGQQLDRRLQENARVMNESKDFLAHRVSAAERSVRSVSAGLGKLEQATSTLQKTSDEIASWQQMLKSPKIRGGFGELLLSHLLSEVLPQDQFKLQYTLSSSGEVADAVIRLQDGYLVAVDAKFPLANYEALTREGDERRQLALRKEFVRDVKKHITDIASKYISPQDKTLDYAFMYIPSEGVYYETIVHDPSRNGLWEHCLSQQVIPVSPNSFLAYLRTVLVGLRGMKIEQQAREILQHLGQLRQDFGTFAKDFSMVGTHLTNAKNRYDDSARRLDKFTNRLDQIEGAGDVPILEESAEEEEYQQPVIKTDRVRLRE